MTLTNHPIRGLDSSGQEAFKLAYKSTGVLDGHKPVIRFNQQAAEIIRKVSDLRKKEWRTTARWNAEADYTGLLGELAAERYIGLTAEAAMAEFVKGLAGDGGHDLEAQGFRLDVKTTKGSALRFKFNKANRFSNLADGFVFCFVEEVASETWVHLLGWATRPEIKPFQRDDGQRLFVRAETLRREGLLKPVSLLKPSTATPQTVTN